MSRHGETCKFAVVLDLDHTLITSMPWDRTGPAPDWLIKYPDHTEAIYKRPGATEFLEYCFRAFRSVGIWTASIGERAKAIVSALLPKGAKLAFLMTREHCQQSAEQYHKPLQVLWDSPILREAGFLPSNTILIDDNPINAMLSLENLILIPPYITPNCDDFVLVDLIKHLNALAKKVIGSRDIRKVDKRFIQPPLVA